MSKSDLPSIAIIADAHCHDIDSCYGSSGIEIDGQKLTLRSWADTRRSSRVFNESKAALKLALKDIQKRNIQHVVLLGDCSDDGQIQAAESTLDIIRHHHKTYGTHFYAVTGNHDAYGPFGKHQSTRFVSGHGETVLVTSDPAVASTEPDSAIVASGMYCEGVPDAITRMSEFGLFRQARYLHWETPFGQNDSVASRKYFACSADGEQRHHLLDASYLVEPVSGLWLLMMDANVFEPRNGQRKPTQKKAFLDSSDAGWNSVLKHRKHVIDWISDVTERAHQNNKTLIAFSHYPVIDPFADHENSAEKLFGNTEMLRRTPAVSVAETLLNSGLELHFSGHLHVSALTQVTIGTRTLEDCAVPSLAAFPAAYKIVHAHTDGFDIDTIQLDHMPLDPRLMTLYNKEKTLGCATEQKVLNAANYGEFLYWRMHTRVIHHYLANEWPKDIAQSLLDTTTMDLALLMLCAPELMNIEAPAYLGSKTNQDVKKALATIAVDHKLTTDDLTACSMVQLVSDWYCLKQAGYLARTHIGADNLKVYGFLAESFGDLSQTELTCQQSFFALFLGMLNVYLQRSEPAASRERALCLMP